jgi:hypothetical protein
MTQYLSSEECVQLILHVGPYRTVVIQGENGVGKTFLAYILAAMPEFAGHIKPAPLDATQMTDGSVWMPWIDAELGTSRELPNERFGVNKKNQKGVAGSKPVLVCLDEIFKVPQFIKNMLAPIIYERRVGDYYMPEKSIVFCCTNMSIEGLGDSIQPHLRSRLVLVTMRKPTAVEWIENFAIPHKLNPAVIAYTHDYPNTFDSFLDYEAGGKYAGKPLEKENPKIFNPRLMQDGFASPRTLHAASDVVNQMSNLSVPVLQAALEGTIGAPTAEELGAYIRFQQDIPSYERVIKDPAGTPIASNPTAQLVQVFQFITRTDNREAASAVVAYVKRMRSEMQTLFCTNVANSQRIVVFANAVGFNDMLRANKIFLNGVK